ncbi:hypothetical protein [Ruminococcus sp.]|uniref:hypothetical protein n=1 Tax=Ruminococcus sp. TaxID=41978 RepID=UPI0025DD3ECF|nr:hypothetical protein [Ruminococcus sp.]
MNVATVVFFLALLLTAGLSVGLLRSARKTCSREDWLWPLYKLRAGFTLSKSKKEEIVNQGETDTEKSSSHEKQKLHTQKEKKPVRESVSAPSHSLSVRDIVLLVMLGILVLLGLVDLFHIVDFAPYNGAFVLTGCTALLEYGVCLLYQYRANKTVRFFGKLLLAATVLELTIFQFPSYHLLLGEYPQKTLLPSEAKIESGDYELDETTKSLKIKGKNEVVITFEGLDIPVGTVQVQAKFDKNTEHTKVVLDAADVTHVEYRYDFATADLIDGRENTQYIPCQLSGDVQKLRVKLTGYNDNDIVTLQKIQLNTPVPFGVSPLRMILIVGLGTLAYAIAVAPLMKKPYEETTRFCRQVVTWMTALVMVFAVLIVMVELPDGGIKKQLTQKTGNQITQELVDAFESGQTSLLKEPSEELLALENPYDWSMRGSANAPAEWDHVLYDGKYYSYYGIAPVVLLYLPYHKLTGYYCSTNLSVLLFSLIGLLFLGMTYLAFVKRWFRKIPAGCIIAGLAIVFSACGIWFSVGRTLFYEISISSGFAFVAMGAYCLITSNILGQGKVSLIRTALASLFLGIAVLCRPTLAVYAVCACIYFLVGIPKAGLILEEGTVNGINKVRRIGYILCAVLPLAALGITQMWYNYVRFDSPFDFGIQYSLTINDFTNSQYHTHFVLIGLLNYLFAVPAFSAEYPFITTPFSKMEANGYYFSDTGNTSGILFLAIPVFAYFFCCKALQKLPDRKSRWKNALLVGLPCVIMPLVIICSIWESGYAIRYTADFSWEIILGAYVVLFFLYGKSQNETKKDLMRKFMAVSMICAIIVNGVQIFNFAFPQEQYPALCDHLYQLVAFWK